MKSINQNKSFKTVAVIVAVGVILGAAILFWKKESGTPAGAETGKEVAQAPAGKGGAKEGAGHEFTFMNGRYGAWSRSSGSLRPSMRCHRRS